MSVIDIGLFILRCIFMFSALMVAAVLLSFVLSWIGDQLDKGNANEHHHD